RAISQAQPRIVNTARATEDSSIAFGEEPMHTLACRVTLSLVLVLGIATTAARAVETKNDAPEDHLLKVLGDSIKSLREAYPPYFSKTSTEKLYEGAINGILRQVDPSGNSQVFGRDQKPADKSFVPQIQARLVEGSPTVTAVIVHSDAFLHDIR